MPWQAQGWPPKSGWWPQTWKSHPFPQIAEIYPPFISLWNYPSYKQQPHTLEPLSASEMAPYSLCGMCFSTSYHHFLFEFFLPWDINNLSFTKSWDQVWSQLKDPGLKSQCGFRLVSSSSAWVHVPIWVTWFQLKGKNLEL